MAGRELDAVLSLLDRQVSDPDGRLVCKVDDLELVEPVDGGPPYVTAILAGPAAVGARLGGVLGRWFVAVQRRLHPDVDPQPARIDFGVVQDIKTGITVTLRREQLEANRFEAWTRDNMIDKIPGARHETE
jgi:hypothetical protein